jgi:hypothetical protein
MKKILLSVLVVSALGLTASAQTEVRHNDKKVKVETPHSETKAKKTSTPGQKVHNAIHRRHKHYSGVKIKHKAKKD